MDNDLLKSMFLKARDQYESAVRWAFILVLVCLVFHLVTLSQFISLNRELTAVEVEQSHLADEEKAVTSLGTDLQELQSTFTEPLRMRLDSMLNDLVGDFAVLNQSIIEVNTPTMQEFAAPQDDTSLQNMTAQQFVLPQSTPEKIPLDPDLVAQIQRAENTEQLRDILRPYIEEKIVAPRFDDLNAFWQGKLLFAMKEYADVILQSLAENRRLFPEQSDVWDNIEKNVSNTISIAEGLVFQPPSANAEWWSSVGGKVLTLQTIAEAVSAQLSVQDSSDAVQQVLTQLKDAQAEQTSLQASITQKIASLETSFKEQEARLATLGKPFEIFALDLDFVVSVFPLLLGVLLAATLIWESYRLRDLAWSVKLLVEEGQGKIAQQWFAAHIGFFPSQLRRPSSANGLAKLGPAPLYLLWIVAAAVQLSGWQSIDLSRAAVFALGGIVAVVVAIGYRMQTRNQIDTMFS